MIKIFNANGTSFPLVIAESDITNTFKGFFQNFDSSPLNTYAIELKNEDGTWTKIASYASNFPIHTQFVGYGYGIRLVVLAGTGGEYGFTLLQTDTLE